MRKRLGALGVSAMIFGAVMIPASPARANHCNTTVHEYQEWLACSFEHVAQCVSNIIRQQPCERNG